MRKSLWLFSCVVLIASISLPIVAQDEDTIPSIERGAAVFEQRCALCHGSQGMGEGKIPLKIKDYPNTNIAIAKKANTLAEIHKITVYGALLEDINQYMPPMGNELTWTEVESVSMFVHQLRLEPKKALVLLSALNGKSDDDIGLGLEVYQSRCVLCHGQNGLGDGRMAKVIKTPPPFNLTLSKAPEAYLKMIVQQGGDPIGRSPQMPPWRDQLSEKEIDAVVFYITTLRQ